MLSEYSIYASRARHGAPISDNSYGSPGEQSQRVFRTIRGTKGGVRAPGVHKGTPKNPKRGA
jgi:hypothetical protein